MAAISAGSAPQDRSVAQAERRGGCQTAPPCRRAHRARGADCVAQRRNTALRVISGPIAARGAPCRRSSPSQGAAASVALTALFVRASAHRRHPAPAPRPRPRDGEGEGGRGERGTLRGRWRDARRGRARGGLPGAAAAPALASTDASCVRHSSARVRWARARRAARKTEWRPLCGRCPPPPQGPVAPCGMMRRAGAENGRGGRGESGSGETIYRPGRLAGRALHVPTCNVVSHRERRGRPLVWRLKVCAPFLLPWPAAWGGVRTMHMVVAKTVSMF